MTILLSFLFPLTTGAGPMDQALKATEAPDTLRAAFSVTMSSGKAERVIEFDPRRDVGKRWQLVSAWGEDGALDDAAASWGAEIAPDGRLFPDDLRASLGPKVEVDDLGVGWRLAFRHAPSANDTALDVWATQRLDAEAWLEPSEGRFLRIDYNLPKPVRGPKGGRLTKFKQSYLLDVEPKWGFSYVSQFQLEFEAKAALRTIRQNYSATITEATFFFSSPGAERFYAQAEQMDLSEPGGSR